MSTITAPEIQVADSVDIDVETGITPEVMLPIPDGTYYELID